ncbi:Npt1/Npt2 family nucleotide transporter [Pseudotamlana agarivorans]|uniref:Npt1/Npt2 family nucleotide transporter n=1 Tax=Pseudotamlana agarivorans TaxID=481183 RepID=UPI00083078AF|nr:Npt1/Npt2 family nucleotide transporter [Tamlana agarivorans]
MVKRLFQKTFHIREGEFKISMFMQLYIFLVITVLLLVKPTINALFLSHLGAEELPKAYLLVAFTAVITAYFYDKSLQFFSIKKIAIVSLVGFSLCFLLLAYILYNNLSNDFILYAYYLSVAIFGVVVTSQFWIIANMIYNAREAKRLFGLIGAGAIIGGIVGGYLTTILSQTIGSIYVILLASILLLFCIPIIMWVWNHRLHNTTDAETGKTHKPTPKKHHSALKVISSSKHLTYLALTIGVSVIMAKLVDYQFSDFAQIKISDPDELASFFGFWFSTFNVLSLVIQLFLTNRLLAWLGVTSNLLLLPLGIAAGCLLFLIFPELWVLILLKGMDGSFKQSINKAAVELSIMPIPYEDKKQAKSFIDVVVDSIATGIAGCLLIFVVKKLDLHSHYITVIILFFLFVWIILIYQLKGAYFDTFKKNILSAIGSHDIDGLRTTKKSLHASVIKILNKGTDQEIISLLESLGDTIVDVHKPHIVKLLDHPSNEVKAAAIKEIYFFKHGAAADKVAQLIETNDDAEVVYEAMEYLLLHTHIDEDKLFKKYLDHNKPYIADAALLCLAELAIDNKKLVKNYSLFERIESRIITIKNSEIEHTQEEIAEFLVTIGYARNPKFFDFITDYLKSDNYYLLNHAVKAAGVSLYKPFIGTLLTLLEIDAVRPAVVTALKNFGNDVPKYIIEHDVYDSFDINIRKHFPKAIASIRTQDSLKVLMRLALSSDPFIRHEAAKTMVDLHFKEGGIKIDKERVTQTVLSECGYYLEHLAIVNILQESTLVSDPNNAELEISLEQLIGLLRLELDCSMNVVFEVLALVLSEDDMEIAYFGLRDESESVKVNSIEFLDNLLSVGLKSDLMPIIEHHFIQEQEINALAEVTEALGSATNCINKLLKDGTIDVKKAVLNLVVHLDDIKPFKNALKQLTHHKDDVICSKALQILEANKS